MSFIGEYGLEYPYYHYTFNEANEYSFIAQYYTLCMIDIYFDSISDKFRYSYSINEQAQYFITGFGWNRIPVILRPGDKITSNLHSITDNVIGPLIDNSMYYTPRP